MNEDATDLATEARRVAEYLNEYPRERGRTFASTLESRFLRTIARTFSLHERPVDAADVRVFALEPGHLYPEMQEAAEAVVHALRVVDAAAGGGE